MMGGWPIAALNCRVPGSVPDDARRLLARSYGIDGLGLTELGSQQDRNFRLEHDGGRLVLKVANSGWPPSALTAQDDILRLLAGRLPGLAVPVPVAEPTSVSIDGAEHAVRLLTYVEGRPLARWDPPSTSPRPSSLSWGSTLLLAMAPRCAASPTPASSAGCSGTCGGPRRWWPSCCRGCRTGTCAGRVERATAAAWERVSTVASRCRCRRSTATCTDDNLVATAGPDGRPVITGVIDFGTSRTGRPVLAELVVGLITVLHHADAGPASVLPAVLVDFHGASGSTTPRSRRSGPLSCCVARCSSCRGTPTLRSTPRTPMPQVVPSANVRCSRPRRRCRTR